MSAQTADIASGSSARSACQDPCSLSMRLVLAALCLRAGASAHAADPTLDLLRAQYEQTISSIRILWTRSEYSVEFAHPEDQPPGISARQIIDWGYDGHKFHHHVHGDDNAVRPVFQKWLSSDGENLFRQVYSSESGYREVEVVWTTPFALHADEGFRCEDSPGLFIGLGFGVRSAQDACPAENVRSLLEAESASFVEFEEVDGHRCAHVDLGAYVYSENHDPAEVDAWFDPEAGGLPRRIRISTDDDQIVNYRVLQFEDVSSGLGSGNTPFPKSMRFDGDGWSWTLDAIEVRINEPLDDNLFRPSVPRGVAVIDTTDQAAAEQYFQTKAAPSLEAERERVIAEAQERATNVPAISEALPLARHNARPREGWPWSTILIIGGVATLLCATWTLRRSMTQ